MKKTDEKGLVNPNKFNPFKTPEFKRGLHVVLLISLIILLFYLAFSCSQSGKPKFDYTEVDLVQLQTPADDAETVVFETTEGTFSAVLFRDKAPKYVEYFTNLVNSGYYNGTYVFNSEPGVYFLGGSKTPDGTVSADSDTRFVDPEISPDLWPIKGALGSYVTTKGILNKKNMAGSTALFMNTIEFTDEFIDAFKDVDGANEDVVNAFIDNGGIPNFSQIYTIFGQVVQGMDVYEKICEVGVDEEGTPEKEIKFEKVYMTTYENIK